VVCEIINLMEATVQTPQQTQKPIKPTSIKILQWVYVVLGSLYLLFWLFVLVLSLAVDTTFNVNDVSSTFILFWFFDLSLVLSTIYTGFTLGSLNKSVLRRANFLDNFVVFAIPILVLIKIIMDLSKVDFNLNDSIVFLVIFYAPLWVINIIGWRRLRTETLSQE